MRTEKGIEKKIQKLKIDDIKYLKELYPRFEADNYTINQYRQSIEMLPPILVARNNVLVDGYHRLLAYKLEGKKEIDVEFFDSQDEKEILIEAIRRNSVHGRQLRMEEKGKLAPRLYKMGISIEKIKDILAVCERKIYDWTEDLRKGEKERRDAEVLELYLQCYSQEQVAEKLEIAQMTVSSVLNKICMHSKTVIPDNLQFYNVWNVRGLSGDQLKFAGQTPITIIENIIYYYTEQPQTESRLKLSKVVDPMAGSGIVREACRKLLRRYMLFDLEPLREDVPIERNNILEGFPEKAKDADLVYFDPPYYNLMEEYPRNAFNKSYKSFLDAMNQSLLNIQKILSPTGKIALILEPMNKKMPDGEWYDLTFDSVSIAKRQGLKIIKRIVAPLSSQQFKAYDLARAKEKKTLLNTLRDIVIFEKLKRKGGR